MANPLDSALEAAGLPAIFEGGALLKDAVVIRVGTTIYNAWQTVSITKNIDSISSTFTVGMLDKWREKGDLWPLGPGELAQVLIGKNVVMNGFIDKMEVEVSNEDRQMSISGRDKTGDLVDTSALSETKKNQFKNVTVKDLADHYCSLYGIKVINKANDLGKKFTIFTVKQGETVFEVLERAAKLRGLLLVSSFSGDLVITNRAGGNIEAVPSSKNLKKEHDFLADAKKVIALARSSVDLKQGENILFASANYDNTERFQQYVVKGQSHGTDTLWGLHVTSPVAAAFDQGVKRYRPLIVVAEGNVKILDCQKRAAWEATTRAAKACEISITVQGWLKPDGSLWDVNTLASVDAGFVGVGGQNLLIRGVTFTKDTRGTLTTLKLTRPDAFNPKLIIETTHDPLKKLGWRKKSVAERASDVNKLIKK